MANLYCKIHRLKSQGWTWDHFLHELDKIATTGIDEKTLKALYRQPHRKATRHVAVVIEKLHDCYFPSPFPDDVESLLVLYSDIHGSKKLETRESDIQLLERFLVGQLAFNDNGTPLRRARLYWLLGNISFDRIAYLRKSRRKTAMEVQQARAVENYEKALVLIQEASEGGKVSEFIIYKLQQNILACYLNAAEPENRYSNSDVLNYVQSSDFLTQSRIVLEREPYQWTVARNALRFSSIMQNAESVVYFYRALVDANKSFKDLDYSPRIYPSLNASAEFRWAISNVISELYRLQSE